MAEALGGTIAFFAVGLGYGYCTLLLRCPSCRWPMFRRGVRYAIVIENAGSNLSAYVPDLPGCVATGGSLAETEAAIREAIEFHLEGLREDGSPIPPPSSKVEHVEIAP
jgi:predicted RNase H-like HicB family nuclease